MIPVKYLKDSALNLKIEKNFSPEGAKLRNYFDTVFKNPLQAKSERFCWDYWSVPSQYRLLRTPAASFFPESLFNPFLNDLLQFGRQNLGCQKISQPWMSAYIDGSFQNLHSDVPHGPFSFVYSLTRWKERSFRGGETKIAKPKLLRYFSEIDPAQSDEENQFFQKINPEFKQLTVFDPRYPHGVERVDGVESILDSRLVIHGWFSDPRPMVEGGLSTQAVSKPLDLLANQLLAYYSNTPYRGFLSLRFKILPSGKIAGIQILSSHLIDEFGQNIPEKVLLPVLRELELHFPKSRASTLLTLPLEIY